MAQRVRADGGLGFDDLMGELRDLAAAFPDKRTGRNTRYGMADVLRQTGTVERVQVTRRKGRRKEIDTYEFANRVPLRDSEDAREVNWCQLITTDSQGKQHYRNAFVTNHVITAHNVAALVAAGRARWKVENENNNTLKTQGYHLTHNFGHGQQYLAATLVSLNLLAFLMHTVFDLDHPVYRAIRGALSSRQMFFQHVQALTCYMYFDNFEALMLFMAKGLELEGFDRS